eukprot:gene3093-9068_t
MKEDGGGFWTDGTYWGMRDGESAPSVPKDACHLGTCVYCWSRAPRCVLRGAAAAGSPPGAAAHAGAHVECWHGATFGAP